ncbi:hypothetical protein Chor_004584 [Crotalus horridus]
MLLCVMGYPAVPDRTALLVEIGNREQLANHTGYIKIDWKMVERDVSKAKKHLKFSGSTSSKLAPEMKSQFDEVRLKAKPVKRWVWRADCWGVAKTTTE